MEKIIELIDTYLSNYSTYENGKVYFENEYCELIFIKNKLPIIIIHGIYIFPEHRQKGYCKDILCYLIDNGSKNFKYLCVQSVLSKVLYEYLLRFNYNSKYFEIKKDGFFYKLK